MPVSLPALASFQPPLDCTPATKPLHFWSHLIRLPNGFTRHPQSEDVGTCSKAYTGPKGGWGESVHGNVWTTGLKTLSLGLSPRWRQRATNHGQGWEGLSISNDRSGGRGRNGSPSHTSSLGQLRDGQEVCEQSPSQSSGATLSFSCLSGHLLSRRKEGKTGKKKDTLFYTLNFPILFSGR